MSVIRKLTLPPMELAFDGVVTVASQNFSVPLKFRKMSRLDYVNLSGYQAELTDLYAWRADENGLLKVQPPILCRDGKDDLFKVTQSQCELVATFMLCAVWGRNEPMTFEEWALMLSIDESCDQLIDISKMIKSVMPEVKPEDSNNEEDEPD